MSHKAAISEADSIQLSPDGWIVVQYIDGEAATRVDEDFRVLAFQALQAVWPCKSEEEQFISSMGPAPRGQVAPPAIRREGLR